MPETADKILAQLNTRKRSFDEMDTYGLFESGTKVTEKPEILFARQDLKEVLEKVAVLHPARTGSRTGEKGRRTQVKLIWRQNRRSLLKILENFSSR